MTASPTGIPGSPAPRRVRRPGWLDVRLVTGVVLVLASVLLGATVVARAGRTTSMWVLTRDLPGGAVLAGGDVRPADVRLGAGVDGYVTSTEAVVGQRLGRPVGRGELVPRAALGPASGAGADLLTVTIPFDPSDVPAVQRGDRLTVWVSTRTCASVPVVQDIAVEQVSQPGGALATRGSVDVVVSVSPDLADRIVTALALDGATVRAGVRPGGSGRGDDPPARLPGLAGCGPATSSGGGSGASPAPSGSPS